VSGQTVTVAYATTNGTATTADADYVAASGTLTFAPGVTTQPVNVTVNGDVKNEANETFTVNLSGPVNATVSDAQGTGTITNDDAMPSLSINDVSVTEGNSGTTTAGFTVSLSAASGQTVTVAYATADGTATTADGDYVAASGTLTFAPGVTTQPINVTVNGDTRNEANETFTVNLSGPVNAMVSDAQGTGTITNDDAVPGLDFYTVSPCRLVDTRGAQGPALAAGASRTFTFAGACGLPSGAKSVSLNVTVVAGSRAGDVVVYPADLAAPGTPTVYFTAGQTRANNAIVSLATNGAGTVAVKNSAAAAVHVVVDVNGYFR
jgi:DNA polymerase IIIc chi subunit